MSLKGRAALPRSMDAPAAVRIGSLGACEGSPPFAGPTKVSVSANLSPRVMTSISSFMWLSIATLRTAGHWAATSVPSRYQIL